MKIAIIIIITNLPHKKERKEALRRKKKQEAEEKRKREEMPEVTEVEDGSKPKYGGERISREKARKTPRREKK